MPANDGRHEPRSCRALVKTISVTAAAIIALALGACSSTATTAASTAASTGPGGGPGTLTGAGSTYVAPFLALAFAKYHQQHPAVTVTYAPVGSSAGIAAITGRQVDFGASDVPMNATELAAAQGGPVTQVSDALAAEGIAYHLDLPAGARLRLTGPVLAAIYLGRITHWDDPAITALNPGITLPGASIVVVHRSDGSGTTPWSPCSTGSPTTARPTPPRTSTSPATPGPPARPHHAPAGHRPHRDTPPELARSGPPSRTPRLSIFAAPGRAECYIAPALGKPGPRRWLCR